MQVSVESTSTLERRMTVVVEEQKISDEVQKRLQDLARNVKLKGFRAGKVPMKVVQQRYGQDVRYEIINDLIQSSFYEAITQEKLHPAGMPSFDPKEYKPGNGLEYIATFEVYPQVSIASFEGVEIEKPVAEITDADLDGMIETIRKQHSSWQDVDRAAQEKDQLIVDFAGKIDGELFEGGQANEMPVEIGAGRLIKGFEEGLIGLKAGEEKTLELSFPEDYHKKELAAKPVSFEITVKKVQEAVLPEVDADFAKKLGIESGDIEQMKQDVRDNMQRELNSALEGKQKQAVMEKLLELNQIEVPQALIESESQALAKQMMQNLAAQGMGQSAQLGPELFIEQAKRRVTLGLIMSEIVKANGIKADSAAVRAKVEEVAEPYEKPEEVVKWYYADKQRIAEVESLVLEQQVVEWAMNQAAMVDNKLTFKEVMNPDKSE